MNQPKLTRPIDTEGIQKILDFANVDLSDPVAVSRWLTGAEEYVKDGRRVLTAETVTGWVPVKGIAIFGAMYPKRSNRVDSKHQIELRALLNQIIENGRCGENERELIDQTLKTLPQPGIYASSGELHFHLKVKTVREWYCLGLGALIQTDLDRWLRQCELDECEIYFVDWPGKRGHAGKPQLYCCRNHGDIDKQRRYRKRKKRENAARGVSI